MTNAETIALSKAISDKDAKAARPGLLPGKYEIDILTRTTGGMKVGDDNPDAITAGALPAKSLVTYLFSKMNKVTRDKSIRDYQEWMTGGGADSLDDDVSASIKACWKPLMESTRGLRRGTVTNTLNVEVLEAEIIEHLTTPEPVAAETATAE